MKFEVGVLDSSYLTFHTVCVEVKQPVLLCTGLVDDWFATVN